MEQLTPKEVQILDIQERREKVLSCHQEHKGEIDAREDSFKLTTEAGQKLLKREHYAAAEVQGKLAALENDKSSLSSLWEDCRILYEQCMNLQLFYRDTEQANTWMAKQEAFLANEDLGDSPDSVEALIKKHEDFEKSLAAQGEKIKALDIFATKLIDGQHYAADDVAQRCQMLRARRSSLQRFHRDIDETKDWIAEKENALNNDDFGKDLRSLQTLQRNHEEVERDLEALCDKICQLDETANRLIQSHPNTAEQTYTKQKEINEMWDQIITKATARKKKLLDSYDFQRYLSEYRDIMAWINSYI